jgi:hypothetical protein
MIIVAAAFSALLVADFVSGTMSWPPAFRFTRDEEPTWFWLAASSNAIFALLALWIALR